MQKFHSLFMPHNYTIQGIREVSDVLNLALVGSPVKLSYTAGTWDDENIFNDIFVKGKQSYKIIFIASKEEKNFDRTLNYHILKIAKYIKLHCHHTDYLDS